MIGKSRSRALRSIRGWVGGVRRSGGSVAAMVAGISVLAKIKTLGVVGVVSIWTSSIRITTGNLLCLAGRGKLDERKIGA
jgi:hypothetical protein